MEVNLRLMALPQLPFQSCVYSLLYVTFFVNNTKVITGIYTKIKGELKCMSHAHEMYGKMEWSELIQPIVDLVRSGVYVTD